MSESAHEVDVLSLIGLFWKHRFLIGGITAIATVISITFAVISVRLPAEKSPLPDLYKPQALILVGEANARSNLQSAIASSGLGQLAGLSGAGSSGYGQLAIKLLSSKTILDAMAERFDIPERYDIGGAIVGRSRKAILQRSSFAFDPDTGTLTISYEETDPVFAAEVVNFFVTQLDRLFSMIGANRTRVERALLETKLTEVQAEISRLEDELQEFQRRYGTLTPEALATEQTTVLAEMRARLINKEIEIETYSQFTHVDDPLFQRLRAERDQLRTAITDMESQFYGGPSSDGERDIPSLAVEYNRLERNIRVQARIYEVLTEQYELAKLSVEGEDPIFQVIEYADIPDLKSGPARTMIVFVSTIGAFLLSLVLALVVSALEKIRSDPTQLRKLKGG